MKRVKLLHFFTCMFFALSLAGQDYKDLPESYQEEVSRKEYRQVEKKVDKRDGEIGLSPIDMIYYDERPVEKNRSLINILTVDSWGRDVMLPSSIRQRVIDECGNYPFVVATVDSGVDEDHIEYKGPHWLPASNYTGQTAKHWHGTHVSGIIWQLVGEVILEHDNGRMKDIQILNGQGSGSFSSAVNMAVSETSYFEPYIQRGVGVILNNSWGYNGGTITSFDNAVKASQEAGITWIGSAGNAGRETKGYPGMSEYFSSVASLDPNMQRSSYSTINEWVDVAAPGSNINSTLPNNQQGKASGTSMASPFIAGLAGLAYGKYGEVLQGEYMNIYLNALCTDLPPTGIDKYTGRGIPLVAKMLDTNPCGVSGIDCDGNPDPDPGPDPDPDPEPDPDPVINSKVTFNDTDGHVIRYRTESQNDWEILYISDIQVSATGNMKATDLQETVSDFVDNYFNFRGIVLTDEMQYTDATWWTAQFLEYVGRNEGTPLQVNYIVGHDEYGHEAYEVGFDRAANNATGVRIEEVDLSTPKDYFDEEDRPLRRWLIRANWTVDNSIEGRGKPSYLFSDNVGVYYTYLSSASEPTKDLINKYPPFPGAKVGDIIQITER